MESVVGCDEGHDLRREILARVEIAVPKASSLQGVEPEFDLIQPTGVQG